MPEDSVSVRIVESKENGLLTATPAGHPLAPFYVSMGMKLPAWQLLAETELPEFARSLLVHRRDMTSTLESYYAESIEIRPLRQIRGGEWYQREVVLRLRDSHRVVEFGASRIRLDQLEPQVRRSVLEARLPLGGILNASGCKYLSHPSRFFSIAADAHVSEALGGAVGQMLFGRENSLRWPQGEVFAEIVEILPSERERAVI